MRNQNGCDCEAFRGLLEAAIEVEAQRDQLYLRNERLRIEIERLRYYLRQTIGAPAEDIITNATAFPVSAKDL